MAKKKKKRSLLTLKIEDLNESGAGVSFYKRMKINIPKTLPGEVVEAEYQPHRPRHDRIRLLNILETSPRRVTPPCQYFENCGGCQLQHLDYEEQLQFKRNILQRLLLTYPSLKGITIHPVVGMPEPFHYRNKSQMPYQYLRGEAVFGLFRAGTHEVISIDECIVESREANQVLRIVRQWANEYQIPIYDETTRSGLLRHVVVRKGMFTHELMILLVVTSSEVPHWNELLQALKMGISNLHSVQLNINSQATNVILGKENIVFWGEPYIKEQIGQHFFRIYPGTFFQINSVQMIKILERMVDIASFQSDDFVLDLYCGVGVIALHVAGLVKKVVGIDNHPGAIEAAQQNAVDNNIINAEFLAEDAEHFLKEFSDTASSVDKIILDPPRKGLSLQIIDAITSASPRKIIYLSCNPRTLVRDLARFQEKGYHTREVFPFDMFPQTAHVESLVVLEKK